MVVLGGCGCWMGFLWVWNIGLFGHGFWEWIYPCVGDWALDFSFFWTWCMEGKWEFQVLVLGLLHRE